MGRMKDWMMDMEEAIYDEMHMNPAAGPDAVVSEAKCPWLNVVLSVMTGL